MICLLRLAWACLTLVCSNFLFFWSCELRFWGVSYQFLKRWFPESFLGAKSPCDTKRICLTVTVAIGGEHKTRKHYHDCSIAIVSEWYHQSQLPNPKSLRTVNCCISPGDYFSHQTGVVSIPQEPLRPENSPEINVSGPIRNPSKSQLATAKKQKVRANQSQTGPWQY